MKLINNKYLALPGLYRIPLKQRRFIPDLIFFLLLVGLPTSFFALVDRTIFYLPKYFIDLNVLFLFVSLVYFVIYFKHLPKILIIPGGKLLLLLVVYLIFQMLYSYFIMNIELKEILIIFRKNIFWPIATLGFLLYAITMDNYRSERLFRWIIIATILQGVIYIFSNLLNIDVFGTKSANEYLESNGTVYVQNLWAVPKYLSILFVFSLITTVADYQFKKYWQWFMALFIVLISVVRSMLIGYALFILNAFIWTSISLKKISLNRNIKIITIVFMGLVFVSMMFPNRVNFVIEKFAMGKDPYISYPDSYFSRMINSSTYGYRLDLIRESFNRTKSTNIIFGNGYSREGEYGKYDFVLGGDTFIATILYCEGIIGLIIRLLPILLILILSMKKIFNKNFKRYVLYYIAMITLIIPSLINIVQASIFVHYHKLFLVFMLMQFIIHRDKINSIKEYSLKNATERNEAPQ